MTRQRDKWRLRYGCGTLELTTWQFSGLIMEMQRMARTALAELRSLPYMPRGVGELDSDKVARIIELLSSAGSLAGLLK